MKIYKIKVNGKTYKVELESVDEIKSNSPVEIKSDKKKVEKPTPISTGEGMDILAPIQGVLSNYKVKTGDHVKKGDVLLLIEAMKLENEVCAPRDGVVGELIASKGSSVTAKQLLMKLK